MHANGFSTNEDRAAFSVITLSFPKTSIIRVRVHVLNSQFVAERGARAQQGHSFRALPASVESCTPTSTSDLPINVGSLCAFERYLRRADILPPLIILALDKLPEVGEGSVLVHAELLDVPCALLGAVHARYAEVGVVVVDPTCAGARLLILR